MTALAEWSVTTLDVGKGAHDDYTVGSLFTGIAGLDLAAEWAGFRTEWQTDINEWALRKTAYNFPNARQICIDVRELRGRNLKPVDVVCGGPPCQPFSDAGNKGGRSDDRYLWPEMYRIIRELDPMPRAVVFENVNGIRNMVLDEVLADLENARYSQRFVLRVPVAALGASHIRYRIFVVAYTDRQRQYRSGSEQNPLRDRNGNDTLQDARRSQLIYETIAGRQDGSVGHATGARLQARQQYRLETYAAQARTGLVSEPERPGTGSVGSAGSGGFAQSVLGIGVDGLPGWVVRPRWPAWRGQPQHDWEQPRTIEKDAYPDRAARVEAIGNAVSPVHAYPVWLALMAQLREQDAGEQLALFEGERPARGAQTGATG